MIKYSYISRYAFAFLELSGKPVPLSAWYLRLMMIVLRRNLHNGTHKDSAKSKCYKDNAWLVMIFKR